MAKRDKEFEARMQGMIIEHDAEVRAKVMNEFTTKLIEELKKESYVATTPIAEVKCLNLVDAIKIINQVAEEYNAEPQLVKELERKIKKLEKSNKNWRRKCQRLRNGNQ